MSKSKAWIHAMRLRTLPLALSSIVMGSFLAAYYGQLSPIVLILAVTTTLFLQILSNLANDYGDSVKGTDNHERVGPQRAVQSGVISLGEMKVGIAITTALSLTSGLLLLYFGTQEMTRTAFFVFLALGIAAILAAIMYTVGKKAYGYLGLGDLFVFLFFGLAGVCGTYILHTHQWAWAVLLPAGAIGFLSMAVLNLNNMRDRIADKKAGKHTLSVRLGDFNSRVYHIILLVGALLCAVLFTLLNSGSPWQFIYLIVAAPLLTNLRTVTSFTDPKDLDPELKKVAMSTFVFSITFGLGLLI